MKICFVHSTVTLFFCFPDKFNIPQTHSLFTYWLATTFLPHWRAEVLQIVLVSFICTLVDLFLVQSIFLHHLNYW